MPKTRASTLSGLITLLVERFLPDSQQRYILPNLKASEWYRKYNDFVPSFLRGRPRSVILHCLNRQSHSLKYTDKDLIAGEEEGVFMLYKEDGTEHVIDFGRNSAESMPSCSCKDWTRWHIPCKHFFAIFRLKAAWNWNSLPDIYLNSPYLTIDKDATDVFFSQFSNDACTVSIGHSNDTAAADNGLSEVTPLLQQPLPVKVRTHVIVSIP